MKLTDEQRRELCEVLIRHATFMDGAQTAVDAIAPLIEGWLGEDPAAPYLEDDGTLPRWICPNWRDDAPCYTDEDA